MGLVLPKRFFTRSYLIRGLWFWLGLRLLLASLGFVLAGGLGFVAGFVGGGAGTTFMLTLAVAGAGWLDAHRRNEEKFLMNLGVALYMLAAIPATSALAAELTMLVIALRVMHPGQKSCFAPTALESDSVIVTC